jgi:hypothetical protein
MTYQRLHPEELEEIECMIINDVSLNDLVKITGKNKTTIYYYFRNIIGKTFHPIIVDESNEELIGEFIGLFAGDGCFYKEANGNYKIGLFFNKTEIRYVEELKIILQKIFRKSPRLDKRDNRLILVYYSKNIYLLIKKYLDWNTTGRKTHSVHLKEDKYSQEFKIGFLRGSLDSDGYFSDKTIMFASSSKRLIENIKSFLTDLNIPYHYNEYVEKRSNRVNMHHVNIRRPDRERLIRLINPREYKNLKGPYASAGI